MRLLVAGDGHLRQNLEDYIQANSIPDVEMLGAVDEDTKRRLYATCDIYCSPAVAGESFGIVLLEATASPPWVPPTPDIGGCFRVKVESCWCLPETPWLSNTNSANSSTTKSFGNSWDDGV